MADYQSYKIPVFPNINDLPTAPSANAPGNGSHLIAQYNEALDAIAGDISDLQARPIPPTQPPKPLFGAILSYGLDG
jgi:hypothetical protein